jgi:hypothetical protein
MAEPRDDSLMNRFDDFGLRCFKARDAVVSVLLVAALLILFAGHSVLKAGDEMNPGIGRTIVVAVGHPSSWIAGQLPLASAAHTTTAFLNPEPALSGPGFAAVARGAQASTVTPAAFPPATIGARAPPKVALHTLLVTGDSMSEPLDSDLAGELIPKGVHVIQDPHIGTGISTTFIVNWAQLSAYQVKRYRPDAVVVFIGANDGFPMSGPGGQQVSCCDAQWAAIYANRVRQMANTYRQDGAAHVYWLTLPTPRAAVGGAGQRDRHRPDLYPGRCLSRCDEDRRRRDDRARVRRHPPQRRRFGSAGADGTRGNQARFHRLTTIESIGR